MTREELNEIINSSDLTEQQIKDADDVFFMDANDSCELVREFTMYCMAQARTSGGYINDPKIHECSYAYIANIENGRHEYDQYLVFLYNREAEYFTLLNSSAESLYYAEKILNLEDANKTYHAVALIYILNILANAKLFSKMTPYVLRIKELLKENIDESYVRFLTVALSDCYAFTRDYESYKKNDELVLEILESLPKDDYLREPIAIHRLVSDYLFPQVVEQKSSDEMISDFNRLIELLDRTHGVMDSYEPLFVPMFDAVREVMPRKEFIARVFDIISYCLSKSDVIAFYNYLMDKCGVTRNEYPVDMDKYFEFLRNYNNTCNDADKQSIEINILEHALQEKYKAAANIDKLTGLLSRYSYNGALDKLKIEEDHIAVVADLNRLKHINDCYGHSMGDRALVITAKRLTKCFSQFAKIYRYGGDEFYLIAKATEEEIVKAIDRMNELNREVFIDDIRLEVSVGYAKASDHPNENLDYLFKIADRNMYDRKTEYYAQLGIQQRN